jgi:hypothetical protein
MCYALFEEMKTVPLKWKAEPMAIEPTVGYIGTHEDWVVTVFRFSIEDQGFPVGSVGYDGALRKGATIVHMTRQVAEETFKRAERDLL